MTSPLSWSLTLSLCERQTSVNRSGSAESGPASSLDHDLSFVPSPRHAVHISLTPLPLCPVQDATDMWLQEDIAGRA